MQQQDTTQTEMYGDTGTEVHLLPTVAVKYMEESFKLNFNNTKLGPSGPFFLSIYIK